MFYKGEENPVLAALVFRPEESKRLIAEAVKHTFEVQKALKKGTIVIVGGSTNAYVARALTGNDIDIKKYIVGWIFKGEFGATPKEERANPIVLIDGEPSEQPVPEALDKFTADDVFIKGANAVDTAGNVGVLAANPYGGTVGKFWALVQARGAHHICPVGLEKLIPSVEKACNETGQDRFRYAMGLKVGLLPLSGAKVITEIEALKILYEVEATHIASGGVMGSEGAVALSVKGSEDNIERMWNDLPRFKISE